MASHFDGLIMSPDGAGDFDKRLTVVITRLAEVTLLTEAALALQYPFVGRLQRQLKAMSIGAGCQHSWKRGR